MTATAPAISFQHNTDAEFREWALALHTNLIACGLVATTDTGQIDFATVVRPVANVYAGYKTYRFNDALQATSPVFIKIEFGTSSSSNNPTIAYQTGSTINGAGVLGGRLSARTVMPSNGASSIGPKQSYFCGNGSSISMLLGCEWTASVGNVWLVLVIERAVNVDGTYNGDGLYVQVGGPAIGTTCQVVPTSTLVTVPSVCQGSCVMFGHFGASTSPFTSGGVGADVVVYPHLPAFPRVFSPQRALLSYVNTDFARFTMVPVEMYGVVENYVTTSASIAAAGAMLAGTGPTSLNTASLMLRHV